MKVGKVLSIRALSLISRPVLSRLYGYLTRITRPRWLAASMILVFSKYYKISMEEFQGSMEDYPSLGAFFTRPLDPAVRSLAPAPDFLISPADGILSHVEEITCDTALQIKGSPYSLSALTGERADWSRGFAFSWPWSILLRPITTGSTILWMPGLFSCATLESTCFP